MKKILLLGLSLFIVGYLGLSWHFSNLILKPNTSYESVMERVEALWPEVFQDAMNQLPEAANFSVSGEDGVNIEAKYFAKSDSSECAVILSHGWTSAWLGVSKFVPIFEDCPCDLVLYDHRAHGASGGEYGTGGYKEAQDLLALTEWVEKEKSYKPEQIGWLGSSWGAGTVLTAGSNEKNVAFIIADAPFQDWYSAIFERAARQYGGWVKFLAPGVMNITGWRAGIDYTKASAIEGTKRTEEPILLIHSQTDEGTGHFHSVNISKHLKHPKSEFRSLDWGGGHSRDVTLNQAKYKQMVEGFLQKIGKPFVK